MTTIQEKINEKSKDLLRGYSEIARLEDELKKAKAFVEGIEKHELPELMEEAELKEFVDTDDRKFTLSESVFVNLTVSNRREFFDWCRKNGLAGIIKTKVEIPFGAGEDEKAQELARKIQADGFRTGIDVKIESSTLRATAKKRLESGDFWPEKLAPTTVVKSVKVKEPK